jgi:hypothetical protein
MADAVMSITPHGLMREFHKIAPFLVHFDLAVCPSMAIYVIVLLKNGGA